MDLQPHIEKFARRFAEVEATLNDPGVFENRERFQDLSREYARLKDLVAAGQGLRHLLAAEPHRRALIARGADGPPFRPLPL